MGDSDVGYGVKCVSCWGSIKFGEGEWGYRIVLLMLGW